MRRYQFLCVDSCVNWRIRAKQKWLWITPLPQLCDNIQADLVLFACQCFPGFEFSGKYQSKALVRVDSTSYQWKLAKWSIMKIPSRERALSRRKCGRDGRRLVMQNIGMRPHCCERFEGEMNVLIMHKLTKDPPPCPQDLWTLDFPSKLTNLYKCWSFK